MDFSGIEWWAYVLTAAGGLVFGILQGRLMKWAYLAQCPHPWMFGIKFLLWALALVGLALISVPLLLVFVVASTITLGVSSAVFYHKAQKEAR